MKKPVFLCEQSCTKVEVGFVSPENIHECLRLTEDIRQLRKKHRTTEDKLEVSLCFFFNYLFYIASYLVLSLLLLVFIACMVE